MNAALLLIDIQSDYFPGGAMEVPDAENATANAALLLEKTRELLLPVIHIQHISLRPGATFFLPGTPGVEIAKEVAPGAEEKVIRKHFPNSFRGTELESWLKSLGVNKLVICGMMTQMCIDATVRAAFDLGFEVTLVHDACAARTVTFCGRQVAAEEVHAAFLGAMGAVYAKVQSTEEVLKTLNG